MENYEQLLQKVLLYPPYNSFKLAGAGDYRGGSRDNPHLSLTQYGLYDFKEDVKIKTLVEIGKELGIVEEPKKQDLAKKIYEEATRDLDLIRAYYQTRGLSLTEKLIDDIGFRVSVFNGVSSVINPIKNLAGEIVSINKVEVDETGNKISKKIIGKYGDDRCTTFGSRGAEKIYCFEGLEDAVTFYTQVAPSGFFLVSYGCGNFGRLNGFLETILAFPGKKACVVLDPDTSGISLEKSAQITAEVIRLIPQIQTDCNLAHREGKLREWVKSLKKVEPNNKIRDTKNMGFQIVNGADVLNNEELQKEAVLNPILSMGEYLLMISPRGVGKSWIAFRLAVAGATGGKFIKWNFARKLKVAYLDGEMGLVDIKTRLSKVTRYSEDIRNNLTIVSPSGDGKSEIPNISDPMGQQYYDKLFDEIGIEMIVIDNYEYCSSELDTGDSMFREWARVQSWIVKHRARGRIIVLVDHTMTHENMVQGVKGKEKLANTTITLSVPTMELNHNGGHMKMTFTKTRGFYGDHGEELYIKQEDFGDKVELTYQNYEQALRDEISRLHSAGRSRGYVIEKLHIPKYLYEDVVKAKNKEEALFNNNEAQTEYDPEQIPFDNIV